MPAGEGRQPEKPCSAAANPRVRGPRWAAEAEAGRPESDKLDKWLKSACRDRPPRVGPSHGPAAGRAVLPGTRRPARTSAGGRVIWAIGCPSDPRPNSKWRRREGNRRWRGRRGRHRTERRPISPMVKTIGLAAWPRVSSVPRLIVPLAVFHGDRRVMLPRNRTGEVFAAVCAGG